MSSRDKEQTAYELMLRLDRLESLLEEMDELGVTTRDELLARLAELHSQVDALED